MTHTSTVVQVDGKRYVLDPGSDLSLRLASGVTLRLVVGTGAGRLPATSGLTGKFLDVAGAAVYLGRSEKSIRNMVDRQQIPYAKVVGRITFDPERLDRWIAAKTHRAFGY